MTTIIFLFLQVFVLGASITGRYKLLYPDCVILVIGRKKEKKFFSHSGQRNGLLLFLVRCVYLPAEKKNRLDKSVTVQK
jgi:hypothetical protein